MVAEENSKGINWKITWGTFSCFCIVYMFKNDEIVQNFPSFFIQFALCEMVDMVHSVDGVLIT